MDFVYLSNYVFWYASYLWSEHFIKITKIPPEQENVRHFKETKFLFTLPRVVVLSCIICSCEHDFIEDTDEKMCLFFLNASIYIQTYKIL